MTSSPWNVRRVSEPPSPGSPWGQQVYGEEGQPQRFLEGTGVLADVDAAGRLVSDTLGKDKNGDGGDLYDALDASRLTSLQYTQHPREWPPVVEVVNARELPPMLLERYVAAGGEGMALCGLFPTISHAWATVDNSLFLWRFDKWDGACVEYNGEEQALCVVGIARPRQGVFIEAIRHLVVLATPVEVVLLGICPAGEGIGESRDPYDDISLQPLPEYSVPSDGVTMTCVACTEAGRIFLGSQDGHLYEILYGTGGGPWGRRCRKVCHTASISGMLSRLVVPSAFRFGTADPIVQLAIDEERQILYALTQESKILVFDLGSDGQLNPRKVTEESHILDSRDIFGQQQQQQQQPPRTSNPRPKLQIVSIAPITTVESQHLHLVAVVSDGRRLYLSTSPKSLTGGGPSAASSRVLRPSGLKVVATRQCPPRVLVGLPPSGGMLGDRVAVDTQPVRVECALYSSGELILSDASPPNSSCLFIATPDHAAGSRGLAGPIALADSSQQHALREAVSMVGLEGRALAIADILPPAEVAAALDASEGDSAGPGPPGGVGPATQAARLWAQGALATQHALPRRAAVVVSTAGVLELALNRPIDTLQRLLGANAARPALEDFFQRFGPGEAAAMCLLLAAGLASGSGETGGARMAERAAEAFEDPRLVGLPQLQQANSGSAASRGMGGGFDMGQLVQESEIAFSGAHEGLCLCVARLLRPVWEMPVVLGRSAAAGTPVGDTTGSGDNSVVVRCRLTVDAMLALESKIRPLELFLRARRNQRRGHYGRVMGPSGAYRPVADGLQFGSDFMEVSSSQLQGAANGWETPVRGGGGVQTSVPKRQRIAYSPADLAAMEVRGLECLRRLLRRAGEALLLLRQLALHHVGRLGQALPPEARQQLLQLSFKDLVCSPAGDQVATQVVAALMQYYVSPGGSSLEEMSALLREGCPSFYSETDRTFFQAVQCLEIATVAAQEGDMATRDRLAGEALQLLGKVPECANLLDICQRFQNIGYYQAVVELPLRKAAALDPGGAALNPRLDQSQRSAALAARQQCYDVVLDAIRSLRGRHWQATAKGSSPRVQFATPKAGGALVLDEAGRQLALESMVRQAAKWPDTLFHERLYSTMVELGLDVLLLDLHAPDLEAFLRSAGSYAAPDQQGHGAAAQGSARQPITAEQAKYLELLSRYYVQRRHHALAAHVLLRLAERSQVAADQPGRITLDQRFEYMSAAVLQARSRYRGVMGSVQAEGEANREAPAGNFSGLLELLEDKLTVLQFQMRIRDELLRLVIQKGEGTAASEDGTGDADHSPGPGGFPAQGVLANAEVAREARELAAEIEAEVKSITQLYNDYAVCFQLWELCLEMLHFSSYASDADNSVERAMWNKLIEQGLAVGGLAEACDRVRRVGSRLYPADPGSLPLDFLVLTLEQSAKKRAAEGQEPVGIEDVARALLDACGGVPELLHRTYERLISQQGGGALHSPDLRLRLIGSGLVVLREWAAATQGSAVEDGARPGPSIPSPSPGPGLGISAASRRMPSSSSSRAARGYIASACNGYLAELRKLGVPPEQVAPIEQGLRDLEQSLALSWPALPPSPFA